MSTTQNETARINSDHLPGSSDLETETVRLPGLVCPRDGTILEMVHKTGAGRFECPTCRQIRSIEEVFVDQ